MKRSAVIKRLKAIESRMRAHGVDAVYLYGSHARDEAGQDSDIDILVDFQQGRGSGLTAYMAPYNLLSEAFPGVEIGYGTRDALVPQFRPYIEQSAIRIF